MSNWKIYLVYFCSTVMYSLDIPNSEEMNNTLMTVGKRLKQLRTERGLTQTDIANLLGMTKGAIQKYECGQIRNFKADTIRILAEFFKVPPVTFIYDEIPDYGENIHDLLSSYFGGWYADFMMNFTSLNGDGQRKVIAYCEDLASSTKYKLEGKDVE